MYLKSIDNKILFEGRFASLKKGLEMAVNDNCDLDRINLRQANLTGVRLDGAKMRQACLWGANLNDVHFNHVDLIGADLRTANVLGTYITNSECADIDFSGTYFSRVVLSGTDLSKTRFSCSSIFSVDLTVVKSLQGAIYSHLGETDCSLSHAPLIISGFKFPMVFMEDNVLIENEIKKIAIRQQLINCLIEKIPTDIIL